MWIFHLYEDGELWSTILGVGGVVGLFWLYIAFLGSFRGYGESSNSSSRSSYNSYESKTIEGTKMIGYAMYNGYSTIVYDENGREKFSLSSDGLVGYTGSTVTVKVGQSYIEHITYDENGREKFRNHY
jgi:hypothetical protein